ncbi:MAG: TIGR03016 family PEP-CTERM system-associated outer membrane protein [Massilia sp.]
MASLPWTAPLAVAALLASAPAAASWKFTPAVSLSETYTDNVNLATPELAQGQFVSDLAPSIAIANDSPRFKLAASYRLHAYLYSDKQVANTNERNREFDASLKSKLIQDFLYLDANATRAQQNVSAFGPQGGGNNYSSANKAEVSTYRIAPYVMHRFGSSADLQVRYTRDSVDGGTSGLGNSKSETASFSLATGPTFRTLGWTLDYNRQQLHDSITEESSSEVATAGLRYRVASELSLTANGGYDKYEYQAPGGESRGKNYAVGFIWTPSLRTSVTASAGRRYFGKSYLLDASHRSRHTVWSINYNDAVTTTRSQFLLPSTINTAAMLDGLFTPQYPDADARRAAVEAYMRSTGLPASLADSVNYFSNRYMLQRQFQASVALNGAHSTLLVSLYKNRRSALSNQQADSELLGSTQLAINDNTSQVGANASYNYTLSSRTTANLGASISRSKSLSTALTADNASYLRLGVSHKFAPKLNGSIDLRHVRGSTGLGSGQSYRENAVSATLSTQL